MIQHLHEFATDIGISAGFAGLCGALAYAVKHEEGKPFKFSEFLLHTVISAICGAVSFILLHDLCGFEPTVCGGLSGISGWMGTRLLRLIEAFITKRLISSNGE